MRETFRQDLKALINRHSVENGSDTPDSILADYLLGCLLVWDKAVRAREKWYGRKVGSDATKTVDAALYGEAPNAD